VSEKRKKVDILKFKVL